MLDIKRETRTGEPMQVGDYEIIPQTRVWRIQPAGSRFGWIWNRPKAVIVRNPEGEEKVLPVRDVTRIMIWAMLAGGLLGAIIARRARRNR